MDDLLHEYIKKPDVDVNSLFLAREFEKNGEYAAAIYFYSRCAEYSVDYLLTYECILKCSQCFAFQGNRFSYEKDLLLRAIDIFPLRPEGRYLYCKYLFWHKNHQECLDQINLSLSECIYLNTGNATEDMTVLISYDTLKYYGKTSFLYLKAKVLYELEKYKESHEIINDIIENKISDIPQWDTGDRLEIYELKKKLILKIKN